MSVSCSSRLADEIAKWGSQLPKKLTLQQLYAQTKHRSEASLVQGAQFLHSELKVRFSQRVNELRALPYNIGDMPSIRATTEMYQGYVSQLVDFPSVHSFTDVIAFANILRSVCASQGSNAIVMIAAGINEYKERFNLSMDSMKLRDPAVSYFLDRIFSSRIGTRLLAGQHLVALEGHESLIDEHMCVADIVHAAIIDATTVSSQHYSQAPHVKVVGHLDTTIMAIPSHLHYILFELIKNSFRAALEKARVNETEELDEVRIAVASGKTDVTIKVSDEGGGIDRTDMPKIWTYLYTTAPVRDLNADDILGAAPIAGYGVGLPMSRLYARYFGGDLQLFSMEGYGTDAYVTLNRLGDIPERVPMPLKKKGT